MVSFIKSIRIRLCKRWQQRSLVASKLLRSLVKANPEIQFVQVGANDGRMADPINRSIFRSRWSGIVIEPVPKFFEQLRETYRPIIDRIHPINVAIASKVGEKSFYYLDDVDNMPSLPRWAKGLGSFRKDIIVSHEQFISGLKSYLREVEVPCLDWKTLCELYQAANVDLVVVDVEGYDFEIIRQIDFTLTRPILIVYEHKHLDELTSAACRELLETQGYGLFKEGGDTWGVNLRSKDKRYHSIIKNYSEWVRQSKTATFYN